jgi:hypothetical protein
MRQRSTRPGRQYAAIPNAAMRDQRLSIEARGVLALLMTYSDDWIFRTAHLLETTGLGRDKFRRVMKELADLGYVKLEAARGDGGRLVGSEWVIQDDGDGKADRGPENPALGDATEALKNRPPVKPTAGESVPLRKPISKKTNLEENQGGSGLFSESETGDLLEHALRIYRDVAKEAGWPDIRAWTPDRRSQLGARLKECGGLTGWEREMRRAATCPHLIGKNDRGWKASLDFFLRKDRFLKLMEGGYDGPTFTKPADPGPSRGHRASAPQWGEVVR